MAHRGMQIIPIKVSNIL